MTLSAENEEKGFLVSPNYMLGSPWGSTSVSLLFGCFSNVFFRVGLGLDIEELSPLVRYAGLNLLDVELGLDFVPSSTDTSIRFFGSTSWLELRSAILVYMTTVYFSGR